MPGESGRGLTRREMLARAVGCASAVMLSPEQGAADEGRPAQPAEPAGSPTVRSNPGAKHWDAVVIGAGVFGAWTAWNMRLKGRRVLLLDAWGPAHARASSGGESRITRTAYGADEIYTRMAWESLPDWRWLSLLAGLPVFHPLGVLFCFPKMEPYVMQTLDVHRRLNLPIESLHRGELAKRFPQFFWDDIEIGLYEPELGALMARRAVQTLVKHFVTEGGEYRIAAVEPLNSAGVDDRVRRGRDPGESGSDGVDERSRERPTARSREREPRLDSIAIAGGERIHSEHFVFACGPWLPKVFPDVLGSRIFVTRQEVFFFSTASGDARFLPASMPCWADFNGGDIYYGFPDLEARGVKVAHDKHGARMDPDVGDRLPSPGELADVRAFMRHRLPGLADRPLNEARVCQYENSSNGDFLIDRHPAWRNVWLVGAGSGHGFKHGPAVGKYAAELVAGDLRTVEPRFSLARKASVQDRSVH